MKDSETITYEPVESAVHLLTERQAEQIVDIYHTMGAKIFEILAASEYPLQAERD